MKKIINAILKNHIQLFKDNPQIEKINVGFTNTVYNINNSYIIKLCTNFNNENSFKKEIEFYNSNKNNNLIPKLYYSNIEKNEIPYFYEIIEKVEGVSLYNVWHTLQEEERENIIKQLCVAMRGFHSNIGKEYDWIKLNKEKFMALFNEAKDKGIFNNEEEELLSYAYSKFEKYLRSKEFVLVHNDLHFDNIIYYNGKIKIIDFERSLYAPKDFELGILYRMIRKPWKFASEETEQYTNSSDYSNIMSYIEKYYPELIHIDYLYQRLAIYDMIYNIKHLIKHPEIEELKKDIILSAKIVTLKDELFFEDVKTPQELMDFMDININYGWVDNKGKIHNNNLKDFRETYKTGSLDETLKTGVGTCIEQAKMIKFFFDKMNIENKVYCHRSYETEENFDKEVRMHLFVLFKYKGSWYHFEHSNKPNRGIYKYDSVDEAIGKITRGYKERGDIRKLTEISYIPEGLTFKEFNQFVNEFDNNIKKLNN